MFILKWSWAIILIIGDIAWGICAVKDLIRTAKIIRFKYLINYVEDYTGLFFAIHIGAIFFASLIYFALTIQN